MAIVCFVLALVLFLWTPLSISAGCPNGFFALSNSAQCFKYFNDAERTWFDAQKKCKAEGLVAPMPSDAVALRKYLLDTYGSGTGVWMDARGDGSKFVWQRDGTVLSNTSPLWFPGWPAGQVSTGRCLGMLIFKNDWKNHPGRPFTSDPCSHYYKTLCEASSTASPATPTVTPSSQPDVAVCSGGCGNGQCTGPNQCTCSRGYTGSSCRTPVCSGGCGNGQCTEPNQCSCSRGYTGSSCRTPVCSDGCGNGQCTGPNKCTCSRGYTGSSCRTPICPVGCGNGQCTGPNKCTCSHGYTGSSCRTQSPEPNPIPRPSPTVPSGQPDVGTCGLSSKFDVDERIHNGRPAISGQYPWMVHFSFFSSFHERNLYCGGTLVSKRWVLTAAHCFRYLKPHITVLTYIGYVNRKQHVPGSSLFPITHKDIITHDGFSNASLVNDIALVHLPEAVKLSEVVRPICLGTNQHIPFGGKASAAGWGLINSYDDDIPDLLHDIELDVNKEDNCENPQYFICTYTEGKDTCSGDSGGPLMVKQGNQWYQVGIVSHGPMDCGIHKSPGVYTRVPNYNAFITSNIYT